MVDYLAIARIDRELASLKTEIEFFRTLDDPGLVAEASYELVRLECEKWKLLLQ